METTKFVYVDVGASGRAGDAGVFGESSLKKPLGDGTLNLPPPITVEATGKVKIIKSENTKIFVLFVLLRSNKYHLLYISICKVFHLNLP